MSRAYRLRIRESLTRVLRAGDHVSTQLELLEILAPQEMAGLLADELAARGFEQTERGLERTDGEVTVRVDASTGTVTVSSEASEQVTLEKRKEGRYYDETDRGTRREIETSVREEARAELEQEAEQRTRQLQKQATDRLERELRDLQDELNGVVNRVTAEALKRKAARIGQIKELTEDPESGSMTIVLEV